MPAATERETTATAKEGLDFAFIRKRWVRASEGEKAQREAILAAKQFRAGDQWPAAIKTAREGGQAVAGQPAQPPRPCLVVDRLSQPVRQVSNTIKNADFGFNVLPAGGGADTETAEIFKGILRRVHNQARAESPIEWAADGAIEGGIGWFRLRTDYVHQTWENVNVDDEAIFDQELRLERIANNLTVYCDPSSVHPTRRDALFMFVTQDLDKDEYTDLYGEEADLAGLEQFSDTGDCPPGWVEQDSVRIAEYWRVDFTDRKFYWLKDGSIGEGAPPEGADLRMKRTMRVPGVKCSKINAVKELEKYDWLGTRIPLFPILGEELNVDGKAVLRGVITEGMDAQRMVNYTYSAGIEYFALESKSPWIAPAPAVANYKAFWDTANIYNYAWLPYDEWDETTGRQYTKPYIDQRDPAGIQAAVMLMRTSEDAIKATTSTGDASLGNTNPNERSGRALQALQAQSDLANSNYPDNVRRAMIDCANEMVYIAPRLYRKGQIVHIMGDDDEPDQVMVGQPFTKNDQGIPQQAPEGDDTAEFYDLTNGQYDVTVSVGKATATKREEGAAAIGELLPHLPPPMQAVATPEYIEQLSFPGAQAMAEKLRKALPPELQEQEEDAQPNPQVLAQQLQQAQMQIVELQQLANDNQAKLQVEGMKQQAEDGRHQSDLALKLEIAKMDNATKLRLEEMKLRGTMMQAEIDAAQAKLEGQLNVQQSAQDQAHERDMSDRDQQAAAAEGERDRQASAVEAERGRQAATETQERQQQHEGVMAEQAAAQTPRGE